MEQFLREGLFALCIVVGMVVHYLKKSVRGETKVNIKEWFTTANLPGSLTAIGSAIMIIVGALAGNAIQPSMNLWAIVYAGIITGIAVDSTANSDGTSKKLEINKEA